MIFNCFDKRALPGSQRTENLNYNYRKDHQVCIKSDEND